MKNVRVYGYEQNTGRVDMGMFSQGSHPSVSLFLDILYQLRNP